MIWWLIGAWTSYTLGILVGWWLRGDHDRATGETLDFTRKRVGS